MGRKQFTRPRTQDKKPELEQIGNKIEKIKQSDLGSKYIEDMEKSLGELRNEHFLSSALIIGRVLDVILSKCDGDKASDKISHLEELGVVERKSSGKVVEAIKNYRNNYSHQVGSSPNLEEAIIILAGTVGLVNRIIEVEKVGELSL